MSVIIEFHVDAKDGINTNTVESPYDNREAAASKVQDLLKETAQSDSPMLRIRDAATGDYVFVHTMKLASVVVREK